MPREYVSIRSINEVSRILDELVGSRSKDIEELKQKLAERFFAHKKDLKTFKIYSLVEDEDMEVVCDKALIGNIGIIDIKGNEVEYDIQLFYIKDILDNYYITETEVLEEV